MADPLHIGPMQSPSAVGAVGNPACGDVVTLYLRIDDGTITAASFESVGSRYQLATASVLCDCVLGQSIEDAQGRTPTCVLEKLPDLPARNRYLAHLAIDALRRALQRYLRGEPGPTDAALESVDPEVARDMVLRLLKTSDLGTLEVEAMLEAEGYRVADGVARLLSGMRRDGLVVSRMSDDRRSWRWALTASNPVP